MSKRKSGRRGLQLARNVRRVIADREARRAMARRSVSVVPTLLTLGNALCGFGAITFAGRWTGYDPTTSMFVSAILIYVAMVFDALDGSAARRLKQTSEFGAQLDSLCDAISFGAAPALLMLQLADGFHPRITWLIAALYVACTVLRLARYNVDSGKPAKDRSFCGLPSPAAAGTVASFPLMVFGLKSLGITAADLRGEEYVDWAMARALPPITLLVAFLMVSRIRYPNTFHYVVRGRRRLSYLIKLLVAVGIIFVLPQVSLPLLFGWYTFSTPVMALWTRRKPPVVEPVQEEEDPPPVEQPRSDTA